MVFEASYRLEGIEPAMAAIRSLPPKFQNKAIRPALHELARIVKKEAKANVLKGGAFPARYTGLLHDCIQVVSLKDRRDQPLAMLIGIPRKSKILDKLMRTRKGWKPGSKPFYWIFLERGFMRKTKNGPVQVPAKPWLKPAFMTSAPRMQELLERYYDAFVSTLKENQP